MGGIIFFGIELIHPAYNDSGDFQGHFHVAYVSAEVYSSLMSKI